jgi:hypothetical protein
MNEVRTTFVPRRPTLATPQIAATRGPDFIAVACLVFFVASVVAAGGVYAWRFALNKQIEGQARQLEKARDAFDPKFVEQASLLNDRIVAANDILDSHLAPTELFELFERFTLRSIAFQSLTAVHQADNSVAISAVGVGKSFESVVLQSDWFGDGPDGEGARLRDVVFSRLGENDRGEATFNFSATIPAERILYARSISQVNVAPGAVQRGVPVTPEAAATTTPAASSSATVTSTAPGVRSSATTTRVAPPGTTSI